MVGVAQYRSDFPALSVPVNGKPFAYLDTASSAQKPEIVMGAMRDLMEHSYANIHRGLYHNSMAATRAYENVRIKAAEFINADSENEIVFTRNTTEAINLVAQSWGRTFLKEGDEIFLTQMEHHANIVPWQLLRDQIGVVIKIIPIHDNGTLDIDAIDGLLSDRTKLVAFTHISNALGTINPAAEIIKKIKAYNADIKVLIDGSQSVVHLAVDVQALGCDFFCFTSHKIYGPTGVGVLWGRFDILESMPPYQGGGDMIETVTFAHTTYKAPPARFEAGTPAIVQVVGLGAAIDYIRAIGIEDIAAHEMALYQSMLNGLSNIDGIQIYGTGAAHAGIVSFTLQGAHPSDIAMLLDKQGVAVRTGHHCCMPLMARLGVEGTVRASLGLYSNEEDVTSFISAVKKAKEMLA